MCIFLSDTCEAVTELLPTLSQETKDLGKGIAIFLSLVAAFKALEFLAGKNAPGLVDFNLDDETEPSDFTERDVIQISPQDVSVQNIHKEAGKSLINSHGEWTGEGTEGFFLDADGNDHYFYNRQPG